MTAPNPQTRNLTVAITGASGSIFPKHLLEALERDERVGVINLVISDSGLRVMAEELGISGRNEVVGKLSGTVRPQRFSCRTTTTSAPTLPAARISPMR